VACLLDLWPKRVVKESVHRTQCPAQNVDISHRQCHPRAHKVDIIDYQVEPNFMNRRKYLPPAKQRLWHLWSIKARIRLLSSRIMKLGFPWAFPVVLLSPIPQCCCCLYIGIRWWCKSMWILPYLWRHKLRTYIASPLDLWIPVLSTGMVSNFMSNIIILFVWQWWQCECCWRYWITARP